MPLNTNTPQNGDGQNVGPSLVWNVNLNQHKLQTVMGNYHAFSMNFIEPKWYK